MVVEMEIVKKETLKNIKYQEKMLGSQADLYTCSFNNKIYVYKEQFHYSQNMINLHERLSTIHNKVLILPEILVSDDNNIVAYLTNLSNYLALFYLQSISLKEKKFILNQVKKAIVSMHQDNIIHCDLHTANILYKGGKVKIIDFDSCVFGNNNPESLNIYAWDYLKTNNISTSLDIFMFNILTISFLYNIAFFDAFRFDFICNLNEKQQEIWQKTKSKKELTYDDFLINYY